MTLIPAGHGAIFLGLFDLCILQWHATMITRIRDVYLWFDFRKLADVQSLPEVQYYHEPDQFVSARILVSVSQKTSSNELCFQPRPRNLSGETAMCLRHLRICNEIGDGNQKAESPVISNTTQKLSQAERQNTGRYMMCKQGTTFA